MAQLYRLGKDINSSVDLQIGNLICQVKSQSLITWEKFIAKNYLQRIITTSEPKSKLTVNLKTWSKENFHLDFPPDLSEANLYLPKTIKSFKIFDFFFKTAIAALFLKNDGFFLHSSSFLHNGQGLIFAGKKGSGKSTILKLASGFKPLNDDFSIIRKDNNIFYIYSSPFHEKNPIPKTDIKAPVNKVFFLSKASKNGLEELDCHEKVLRFASLILMPNPKLFLSPRQSALIWELIWSKAKDFAKKNQAFMLYFKKDPSFLKLLELENRV